MSPELSVVVPAYNEEGAIAGVLAGWTGELSRLGIDYEIRVYDDGSRDRTGDVVAGLAAANPRIVATRQQNRGHGPTVLRGYLEAGSAWIFQVDGDGEIGPGDFEQFWRCREQFDFLIGYRADRQSVLGRRLISAVSRQAVRMLFGSGVRDVNTPYRLMRRTAIAPLLPFLEGTFAPNVILAGLAVRAGLRIYQAPVHHRSRMAGVASIGGWKLWRSAIRSFWETVTAGLAYSRRRPR
jgi:dolichol-phosphate mannosyltransferase